MTRIVIVVPIDNPQVLRPADLQGYAKPGVDLVVRRCNPGMLMIRSEADLVCAAPAVLAEVVRAESDGADVVVIDLMADIGIAACRELVDVPVVGLPEAAMTSAMQVGETFSVVSSTRASEKLMWRSVRALGVADRLVSVRAVELDAHSDYLSRENLSRLAECCQQAVVTDRADVLIFGSGRLFNVSRKLRATNPNIGRVPFVEPLGAGIAVANALVAMGVKNSRASYPAVTDHSRSRVVKTADPVA